MIIQNRTCGLVDKLGLSHDYHLQRLSKMAAVTLSLEINFFLVLNVFFPIWNNHLYIYTETIIHLRLSEYWGIVRLLFPIIIHQIFLLTRDWPKRVTWPNIPQLKLGNIREYSPILKIASVAKKIWRIIKTIVPICGDDMLGYLSLDIICSS